MKTQNTVKLVFPAISENERTARAVVSAFLTQADPTVEELADIRTAVNMSFQQWMSPSLPRPAPWQTH